MIQNIYLKNVTILLLYNRWHFNNNINILYNNKYIYKYNI